MKQTRGLKIITLILLIGIMGLGYGGSECGKKKKYNQVATSGSSGGNSNNFPLPVQVISPNPIDDATNVPISTQLNWTLDRFTTSCDVYFGITTTGWSPVASIISNWNPPGNLNYNTTYYWRIDSKNYGGTTTGNIWSFHTESEPVTVPAQVTLLYPINDGTSDMSLLNPQLSWIAANGATSYDVYLGITTTGWSPVTNTTDLTYNPEPLNYSTTYYWRIDSKNSFGTTQGVVRIFTTPAQWYSTIIDSNNFGFYGTSIAVDSNNKIYISYDNYGNADLKYATNATGSWLYSTLDSSEDVGMYSSIAIDSNNKVHISYLDATNGDLKYAANTTGSWVYSTIDSGDYVGEDSSIAIDSNNKVHISYIDATNAILKYATNASGSWVYTIIDSIDWVGWYSSIAIDFNNKVHISYYDATNGDLKYATNATGSWVCSTLDSTGDVGVDTSIAIDSNNKVHISYYDNSNYTLKYATNTTGLWVYSTLDSTGYVGQYSSIAIDSNNKVHISYVDVATMGALRYATNATGSWVRTIADSARWGGYYYTSIAIDSDNKVHISYRGSRLKYATNK